MKEFFHTLKILILGAMFLCLVSMVSSCDEKRYAIQKGLEQKIEDGKVIWVLPD